MFNRFFKKIQPVRDEQQTLRFTSVVTGKRFKLEIDPYKDYAEMDVSTRMVTFTVYMPSITMEAFRDEEAKELLYALREAVIAASVREEVEGEVLSHE